MPRKQKRYCVEMTLQLTRVFCVTANNEEDAERKALCGEYLRADVEEEDEGAPEIVSVTEEED